VGDPVVSVESLHFNLALSSPVRGSVIWRLRVLGNEEELAVSQHAVYVEEEKLDFTGARLGGQFWHQRDFNIQAFISRSVAYTSGSKTAVVAIDAFP
jgi:hypothetical protein